jgi:hypothetical protein
MRRTLKYILRTAACCLGLAAALGAADSGSRELGDLFVQKTAATLHVYTDKVWYTPDQSHIVRWTAAPQGDPYPYAYTLRLENIETGEKLGWVNTTNGTLSTTPIDILGNAPGNFAVVPVPTAEKMMARTAPAPSAPGHYHYVLTIWDSTVSRPVKEAWSKFQVRAAPSVTLGPADTEISSDTTWSGVVKISGQVFVNDGATLTVEPGTTVLAAGQNAVIVIERGGQLQSSGRKELPIVYTCDAPVGERFQSCWAGLIFLGKAPVNVAADSRFAEGVIPATRPIYGGGEPDDSSGSVTYTRVEFAGVDFTTEIQPNAYGFHGVGAGTEIHHIQAHLGEDDGIEFFGGTVNAKYVVSSGSKDDSIDWTFGWQGNGQFFFVQQSPVQGDQGLEMDNNELGPNNEPRSNPRLHNVSLIGSPAADLGFLLRLGAAMELSNCVITGFGEYGARITNDETFANTDAETIRSCTFWNNAGANNLAGMIEPGTLPFVQGQANIIGADPKLRNLRWEPNPDPRPLDGSPVFTVGASVTPPSITDGFFDTDANYHGAFGEDLWIEEWTRFGDESWYSQP